MSSVQAQVHYVAADGSDGNSGLTPAEAWRTLNKVQLELGSNKTFRFRRGDTFEGSIHVTGRSNIVFEDYGTGGEDPVLKGTRTVSGWQPYTVDDIPVGGIHYAPITLSATSNERVVHLYHNGSLQRSARHPNTQAWGSVDNCTDASITDDDLPGSVTSWPGTELIIRARNWGFHHTVVTDRVGVTLYVPFTDIIQTGIPGWGYQLRNKLALLDAPEEWFVGDCPNGVGTCVYYWPSDGNLPTGVEVAVLPIINGDERHEGIYFEVCTNAVVTNITFQQYVEAGVQTWNTVGATITDCTFRHCYTGIKADQNTGAPAAHEITGNVFEELYDAGIRAAVNGCTVRENVFRYIGLLAGEGSPLPADGYFALSSGGTNALIERNTIHDIGYTGMLVSGNNVIIRKNHITRTLLTLNDGGGIMVDRTGYASYPAPSDGNWSVPTAAEGMTVEDNIISDIQGNFATVAPGYSDYRPIGFGIYFDERPARGVTVQRNTVSGCEAGIHVDHTHGNNDNLIADNTLFNNSVQLSISDYSNWRTGTDDQYSDQGVGGDNHHPSYNNTYQGNILYALSDAQRGMTVLNVWSNAYSGEAGLVDFGTFSDNYYFHTFSSTPVHVGQKYTNGGNNSFWMPRSLERWQELTGQDLNSHISPVALPAVDLVQTTGVVMQQDFGSAGSESGWETCTSRVTGVENMNGYALLSEGLVNCRWVRPTTPFTAGGTNYRLSLRIKAEEPTGLFLGIQLDATNELIGTGYIADASADPITLFFTVPQGSTIRPMVRKADQVGQVHGVAPNELFGFGPDIWVDEVVLESCSVNTAYPDQIAAEHILRYYDPLGDTSDPQNTTGSFTIPGDEGQCWSDVYGNFHAAGDTYELAEWASVVLFRIDVPLAPLTLNNGTYTVSGTETWTEHWNIDGNVEVPNGATLIIDGAHIGFPAVGQTPASNMTVEPGGTLILRNGAALTSWQGCTEPPGMWGGVKALSSYDPEGAPQQTWPGQVRMESGARIQNALVGVLCGEGDPSNPGYVNSTPATYGGVIETTDAVFENNRFDVVSKQWVGNTGTPSSSLVPEPCQARIRFVNTTFRTTAPLLDAALHPVAHLRVADNQPFVHGCTFANELPTHTSSLQMGHGIDALNANLRVGPCLSGPCITNSDEGNTFRNLDHAIRASASYGSHYLEVKGNTFTDNICAVYLKDLPGAAVRENSIEMGRWDLGEDNYTNPDEEHWQNHHRAIFATGSNALNIQDNSLLRSSANSTLLEGIVVGYTRDNNEVVFRNTANNLDLAYVGEGVSADVEGDPDEGYGPYLIGLQFQCNENTNNATNIHSRIANGDEDEPEKHTIRARQGTPAISASNVFDGAMHFAVSTYADAIADVVYCHATGQAPATYTEANPNDVYADYVSLEEVNGSLNCATDPPVFVYGGGNTFASVKPQLTSSKLAYGNLRYQYEQLIDGGSTDEVVQQITASWSQYVWDLRDSLLARSPFLSTEALKELVDKDVPVAMKAEVLIANPDATRQNDFLKWAELYALYPIPGYLAEAIEASWSTVTYRTTLEQQLADAHTTLTQTAWHALALLHKDSLPAHPDTLRWVWQQVRTTGTRHAEAALLIGQGRYSEADSLMGAMATERHLTLAEEAERQRMLTYIAVLAGAASDDRNPYQLSNAEVDSLEAMVGAHYDRPANWASNLLCAVYAKCRPPYTGDAGAPKNGGRTRDTSQPPTTHWPSRFGLFPNPAKDVVVLLYDIDAGLERPIVVVRDATGRRVDMLRLNGTQGQQNLDTSNLAPGLYVLELQSGSLSLHSERLVIQK